MTYNDWWAIKQNQTKFQIILIECFFKILKFKRVGIKNKTRNESSSSSCRAASTDIPDPL